MFIPYIPVLLQSREHDLVRLDVLERTELLNDFAHHFAAGKAQQLGQKRVYIPHAAIFAIQDHDAVVRRFEQTTVTQFGRADRGCTPLLCCAFEPGLLRPRPRNASQNKPDGGRPEQLSGELANSGSWLIPHDLRP
jgi:hypothetical protein